MSVLCKVVSDYLIFKTIPRVRVGYELALIISYPTSTSGIIVLLKLHKISRIISDLRASLAMYHLISNAPSWNNC